MSRLHKICYLHPLDAHPSDESATAALEQREARVQYLRRVECVKAMGLTEYARRLVDEMMCMTTADSYQV